MKERQKSCNLRYTQHGFSDSSFSAFWTTFDRRTQDESVQGVGPCGLDLGVDQFVQDAHGGIDVAFAKNKRLPVVVCVPCSVGLAPLPLRTSPWKPPAGRGNARILDGEVVQEFAEQIASYFRRIESAFGVRIVRIAIDAPSDPKAVGAARRQCEIALDRRRISCIATPRHAEFDTIRQKALRHLASGGAESHIPGASQLWMLVGFEVFRRLRHDWECLEVFPQAIAAVLGARDIHKSHRDGVLRQLAAAARYTGWPTVASRRDRRAHAAGTIAELSDHRQGSVASDESAESGVPQLGDSLCGQRCGKALASGG
jgi:hypothetical protein